MSKITDKEVSIRDCMTNRVGNINRTFIIKTRHSLFLNEDYLEVFINEEYLEIKRVAIDSTKNSYELKDKQGVNVLFITTSVEIDTGLFEIDEEESNEDLLIVYF